MAETEADLMRRCGHLYVSIALESFATTLMSLTFAYLLLLITNKGRLKRPGAAVVSFLKSHLFGFLDYVAAEVAHWREMDRLPLDRRFAFCRTCNQAICVFQILVGVLTIERWLHINNVNGFRYLGYALTCPPMQSELVILIAPVVPCFCLNVVLTYFITTAMLLFGYAASLLPGDVYTGSFERFWETQQLEDLGVTTKFCLMLPAMVIQAYLSFVQIPCLLALHLCHRGSKAGLPHGYWKLLFIVSITWLAFPVWWCLSYEGFSIITDTKMNAAGFTLLNVISKGSFTLQMLSMSKRHRRQKAFRNAGGQDLPLERVFRPSNRRDSYSSWVVAVLRPYDSQQQGILVEWQALEAPYRAFLVGRRVTPVRYCELDSTHRAELRAEYERMLGPELGTGMESSEGAALSPRSFKDSPRGSTYNYSPDLMPDDVTSRIRVGQTLTTVYGTRGRVLSWTSKDVRLQVPGQGQQVISADDLTVLKVTFLNARGLHLLPRLMGSGMPYCSCVVEGKPTSEVASPVAAPGSKAVWDHEADVLGYSPCDILAFRVWTKDLQTDFHDLIGEARISGSKELRDGTFDGELQMYQDGVLTEAYLSVAIWGLGIPFPSCPTTPSHIPRNVSETTSEDSFRSLFMRPSGF